MNLLSQTLFWLGYIMAAYLAVGMDPYSCGLPLVLMAAALLVGAWTKQRNYRSGWISGLVVIAVGYFAVQQYRAPVQDFGRSDGLLLSGAALSCWFVWSSGRGMVSALLYTLWMLVLVNVIAASIQAFGSADFYPGYGARSTTTYPSGLYLHYNHFANFMVGAGLFSLGMAMAGRLVTWMKATAALIFVLSLYGVYLSHSRGAWLAMGIGLAVVVACYLLLLWQEKKSYAGPALIAVLVLAPVVIMLSARIGDKVIAVRGGGDSGRMEMASMALDMIQEKPLWGGGSRSFFFDSIKKWNAKELYVGSGDVQYVHNEYLQAAVDYGLIGLGLLLAVFGLVIFRGLVYLGFASRDGDEGDAGLTIGAIAALVGMGTQAFFSFVYHVLPDVMLMGCLIGILLSQPWALATKKVVAKDAATGLGGRIAHGLVGSALGAAVLLFALRDCAAWFVINPQLVFTKQTDAELVKRLEQAITLRPDFRVMSELSMLLIRLNKDSPDDVVVCKKRVEQAIENSVSLLARAPDSYQDRLNLALMYDSTEKFSLAEPLYRGFVDILDCREVFYGARYHYSRHLYWMAHGVWKKRNPELALTHFIQARGQLIKAAGRYRAADHAALLSEIGKCITFLEGANIKAAAE